MALVSCENCGNRISTKARSCPKCGRSMVTSEAACPNEAVPRPRVTELRLAPTAAAPAPVDSEAVARRETATEPVAMPAEAWYYVTSAGRQGPVGLELLHTLVAAGRLSPHTSIWKAGLSDWVILSEHCAAPEKPAAEGSDVPVAAPSGGNLLSWTLALAPLWGAFLQILATEVTVALTHTRLAYYSQFWWITVLANLLFCYLDFNRQGKMNQQGGKMAPWLWLAVPAYIYRREKEGCGKLIRLWVWVGSLIMALTVFVYLNNLYTKISMR